MQVYYRAAQAARRSVGKVFEAVRVSFCCREMQRQWGRIVSFGVLGHRRSTDQNVNIPIPRPQANGKMMQEVVAIGCCPWCGEAIETVRTRPIRMAARIGETNFGH